MCGRYRRRSDKQRIAETFHVGMDLAEIYLDPEEDVAPGSMQPVVLTGESGEREIALMRWGFKLPDRLLFNARSEEIERAGFWKDSFQKRRCIVPADAIFERSAYEQGKKKPKYEVAIPGQEPFGMAGVWKPWKNPKTQAWERTFAVITGEPNELTAAIHPRLTTILDPRDYEEYLGEGERPPVHLLRIPPAEKMRAERVKEAGQDGSQPSQGSLTSEVPAHPSQVSLKSGVPTHPSQVSKTGRPGAPTTASAGAPAAAQMDLFGGDGE